MQLSVAVPHERGLLAAARDLAHAREGAVRAALQERGVAAARVLPAGEAKAGEAKAGEAKAGEAAAGGGGGLSADDGAAGGDGAGGAAGAAGAVGAGAALLELLPEANAVSRGDTVGGDAVASAAAGSAGLEARWAAACALAARREAGLQQAHYALAWPYLPSWRDVIITVPALAMPVVLTLPRLAAAGALLTVAAPTMVAVLTTAALTMVAVRVLTTAALTATGAARVRGGPSTAA